MTRILKDREENFLDKKSSTKPSLREQREGLLSRERRIRRRSERKGEEGERCWVRSSASCSRKLIAVLSLACRTQFHILRKRREEEESRIEVPSP